MSGYLSIRFGFVWAFSSDGASVQKNSLPCLLASLLASYYEGTFEGSKVECSETRADGRNVTDFASQQGVLEVQKLGGIPPRIPPRIPPSHAWAEFDFSKVLFANSAQVKFWSGSQEFFPNFPPDRK